MTAAVDVRGARDRALAVLADIRKSTDEAAGTVDAARVIAGRACSAFDRAVREQRDAATRAEGTQGTAIAARAAASDAERWAAAAQAELATATAAVDAARQHSETAAADYQQAAARLANTDPEHPHLCHCYQLEGQPHAPHPDQPAQPLPPLVA